MAHVLDGLPIAVDAMGGDRAPAEVVAGALQAAQDLGIPVLLVGDGAYLGSLGPQPGVEILATTEVIEMDEDPGKAIRVKRDSSLDIEKIVFEIMEASTPMGISASTSGIFGSSGKLSRDMPAMRVLERPHVRLAQ